MTLKVSGYVDNSLKWGPIKFYLSGASPWSSMRLNFWVRISVFSPSFCHAEYLQDDCIELREIFRENKI